MKVFISYSSKDKELVKPIAAKLKKIGELDIWLDDWSMSAGDSLIDKIGQGIEEADRLIVFLSPSSVDSNWVKKEVATGLIMELAEKKGRGEKFVIPAMLLSCAPPVMLSDKVYANFTNKSLDAACEELYRGIVSAPLRMQDEVFENAFARYYTPETSTQGTYGLLVELGVKVSPTDGASISIDVGSPYSKCFQAFGPPGTKPVMPQSIQQSGLMNINYGPESTLFVQKFSEPGITSKRSYYIYFEGSAKFSLKNITFRDFYDRVP